MPISCSFGWSLVSRGIPYCNISSWSLVSRDIIILRANNVEVAIRLQVEVRCIRKNRIEDPGVPKKTQQSPGQS